MTSDLERKKGKEDRTSKSTLLHEIGSDFISVSRAVLKNQSQLVA